MLVSRRDQHSDDPRDDLEDKTISCRASGRTRYRQTELLVWIGYEPSRTEPDIDKLGRPSYEYGLVTSQDGPSQT